ncbi:MAG: DNA-directed RNA polymerase subunit alpha, DNA-directed RNA polymerase subunit alpha [candidate division WS6 bacterium GW2011_GWC1_33_20]|uniref:DNA-directed RNA polymerase subunit alpha n=2 Tax=Candidatus Dojkabacteria TaxID=74243 RepID=A0A0G0ADE1_9BACT|nr:MAG: DNA-directed RNA polymerase subunit alpha, DNA-directed RNA polymerase subunit alpha [candidate division WS6 bacterium GW2011_GWE2_33_157]KKP44541.1 MAG: DNA-directed RNA polymerase subunit alpha, DNA-directed RNA polymerase subunit alpha [candidate division WS6 bacterium GW2011_GWC1_33_20]KKP46149.1 MAG: DNA-directed RNA polymerase subunit alpha, DNA-directed RNA polymerase subunit alpha [candidate division WS6 bacterium GW2011_GWF1_33_233]KKP54638.1 MAG: DNA-directed RNA polymerase sub
MEAFKDIKVIIREEEGNSGLYEISPLPRGYGHTLGNSIRRILYSSLKGSGITSIKVKGAKHEYSTIDGVKEDLTSIILNLKQVKFRVDSDEAKKCRIEAKGKQVLKASDIIVDAGVIVTTPDIVIANLTDESAELVMDLVVESGIGYRDATFIERPEVGVIPLDCDFAPIEKVSLSVEQARKGQETDLDSVVIGVLTDGSIAPKDALLQSAQILQEFSGKVMIAMGISKKEVEERAEEINQIEEVVESVEEHDEASDLRIEDLPISKRSKTGLLSGGYKTLGDLKSVSVDDLLNLSGFGNKSLNEVVELLNQYGINIKGE